MPDTQAFRAANGPSVTTNSAYILSVSNQANLRTPDAGEFEFRLQASEAFETKTGVIVATANVTGGTLSVNFGAKTFRTTLNIELADQTVALLSKGRLFSGGFFEGDFAYSTPGINMNVRGQFGGTLANQAAYLFDAPLTGAGRGLVGAASWGR